MFDICSITLWRLFCYLHVFIQPVRHGIKPIYACRFIIYNMYIKQKYAVSQGQPIWNIIK